MTFKEASGLRQGVPIYVPYLRCDKINMAGNYLIKDIQLNKREGIYYIETDNDVVVTHEQIKRAIIKAKTPFYCSWYGMANDIMKTGLQKWQLMAIGLFIGKQGTGMTSMLEALREI